MEPSQLSAENIIATAVAGVGLGLVALWKYLKELKAPTGQSGDRLIPGVSIADMKPFDKIAAALERSSYRTWNCHIRADLLDPDQADC